MKINAGIITQTMPTMEDIRHIMQPFEDRVIEWRFVKTVPVKCLYQDWTAPTMYDAAEYVQQCISENLDDIRTMERHGYHPGHGPQDADDVYNECQRELSELRSCHPRYPDIQSLILDNEEYAPWILIDIHGKWNQIKTNGKWKKTDIREVKAMKWITGFQRRFITDCEDCWITKVCCTPQKAEE